MNHDDKEFVRNRTHHGISTMLEMFQEDDFNRIWLEVIHIYNTYYAPYADPKFKKDKRQK